MFPVHLVMVVTSIFDTDEDFLRPCYDAFLTH